MDMCNSNVDWQNLTIDDVADIIDGDRSSNYPKREDIVDNGILFLNTSNIVNNKLDLKNVNYISEETFCRFNKGKLKRSDIVITLRGTIGNTAIFETEYNTGFINAQMAILRTNKITDEKYLHQLLCSDIGKNKLISATTGSAQPQLPLKDLKEINFNFPPLPEQKKIAAILSSVDSHFDLVDAQIADLQELKKGMVQKLLTEGIGHTRFKDTEIGRIPEEWNVLRLIDIVDNFDRYSFAGGPFGSDLKSEHYTVTGIRVIQLQNIGDGEFRDDYKIYTSHEKADELIKCNIYSGEIIISKMADPIARACIMPGVSDRFLMCSDGIRISLNLDICNNIFIMNVINSPMFRNQAEEKSTGSTRKRIGLSELKNLLLPVPSLDEQKSMSKFIKAIDEDIQLLKNNKEDWMVLKNGLMQQLLTGKKRVTV